MFCEDFSDSVAGHHVNGSPRSEPLNGLQPADNSGRRNDLCSICSQNQLLKIKQLANFVPQNEVY